MDERTNEERLDRLESAFQKKANADATAIDSLSTRFNEIIARLSLLETALSEEMAFHLAKEPVDDSTAYKNGFLNRFITRWETTALEGSFLGGSEKREAELLDFLREITRNFIHKISDHENFIRQSRSGDMPSP